MGAMCCKGPLKSADDPKFSVKTLARPGEDGAGWLCKYCMKATPAQMKFHPRSHAHPRRRAPLRDTLIHTPLHLAPLDIYTLTHGTLTSE